MFLLYQKWASPQDPPHFNPLQGKLNIYLSKDFVKTPLTCNATLCTIKAHFNPRIMTYECPNCQGGLLEGWSATIEPDDSEQVVFCECGYVQNMDAYLALHEQEKKDDNLLCTLTLSHE